MDASIHGSGPVLDLLLGACTRGTTTIPAPGSVSPNQVCGVSEGASPNTGLVSLAGYEVPRSALDRPEAQDQNLDTLAATALRASLHTPVEENAPRTGWRLVVDQPADLRAPNMTLGGEEP